MTQVDQKSTDCQAVVMPTSFSTSEMVPFGETAVTPECVLLTSGVTCVAPVSAVRLCVPKLLGQPGSPVTSRMKSPQMQEPLGTAAFVSAEVFKIGKLQFRQDHFTA